MKEDMTIERSSGILLHITSLPGKYGIGDLGPGAHEFLQFLKDSGHSYWQLLPLNPTDEQYKHSPYSTHAAFAGNPLLISPELLEKAGLVALKDFSPPRGSSPRKVSFSLVEKYKKKVLEAAWKTFREKKAVPQAYARFTKEHAHWLDDYCLYEALRHKYGNTRWTNWPEELRDRQPAALDQVRKELKEPIAREKFIQYLFFSQWEELAAKARKMGIRLFGDVPFYINHDSVDCWKYPAIFKLDASKEPTHISGVPPDLFSDTGQLWGTPVYDWKELKKSSYAWWVARLKQNLLLFDVVRLDHFRAFSGYWEVPASEPTAKNGKWVATPGTDFFERLRKEIPDMPFIAEDLGSLDQGVYDLLEQFNFPRMKVLQFAFGEEGGTNPYLPYNHLPNDVVYTGTHDNNTSIGWIRKASQPERKHLRNYVGRSFRLDQAHKVLHRLALQSVAKLSILPMQDILGLGEEGLMNIPGSTTGNWTWRAQKKDWPDQDQVKQLRALNKLYGR